MQKAIRESGYLQKRVRPTLGRGGGVDNAGLRQLGEGFLYFRSDAESQLIGVDADVVLLDEVDRMDAGTVAFARKRLASSRLGWTRAASTPGLPEAGINALYVGSDQRRYLLPCPACGHAQPISCAENVDLERALVACRRCYAPLDLIRGGRWEAAQPATADRHGYQLSRLLLPGADLPATIQASQASDPWDIQHFYNSDLGEPWVPAGAQLSLADLDAGRAEYAMSQTGSGCAMGVDAGKMLHVDVRQPLGDEGSALAFAGTVPDFAALDDLMRRYGVSACVIDAQAEQDRARDFRDAWAPAMASGFYKRDGDHAGTMERGWCGPTARSCSIRRSIIFAASRACCRRTRDCWAAM